MLHSFQQNPSEVSQILEDARWHGVITGVCEKDFDCSQPSAGSDHLMGTSRERSGGTNLLTEASDALRYLIEDRPFGRVVLTI